MRCLIDTHVFIWWAYTPSKLSTRGLETLRSGAHQIFLSYASIWEMQIKEEQLALPQPLASLVTDQVKQNNIELLSIETQHIFHLAQLPFYKEHRDPFDRMLIAQAVVENMTLVTADHKIRQFNYGIPLLWD